MKIYCDKILVPSMVILAFLIFDGCYFAIVYDSTNLILLTIINVVLNIIGIPLISHLFIRRLSRVIFIYDNSFEYISNNEDSFNIQLSSISNYVYMKNVNGFYTLRINKINGQTKELNLTKRVIKKIAKFSGKKLTNLKNENIKPAKEVFHDMLKSLKKNIKENIDKIISAIIGLVISVTCILLYNFFDNIYLTIVLCVISYIGTFIQVYLCFTDNLLSKKSRVAISMICPIVFYLIFLLVCMLIFKDQFIFTDIICYSIFILPAFIVVFVIILLILYALSYA